MESKRSIRIAIWYAEGRQRLHRATSGGGQDGADEADQGVAAGKDPDDVGAAADLAVHAFLRVIGPDLPPDRLGKAVKASMSARACGPGPLCSQS